MERWSSIDRLPKIHGAKITLGGAGKRVNIASRSDEEEQ
jgi:hypothetical protein